MQILKGPDWEEVHLQLNRELTKRSTRKISPKQINPGSHLALTKQALRNAVQGTELSEPKSTVNIHIISIFPYFRV